MLYLLKKSMNFISVGFSSSERAIIHIEDAIAEKEEVLERKEPKNVKFC